jgi:hypothetical protein
MPKARSRPKASAPVKGGRESSNVATAAAELAAATVAGATMIETVTVVKKRVIRAKKTRAIASDSEAAVEQADATLSLTYVQYKGAILNYLGGIRPREATLDDIRANVSPPVTNEDREEILEQDLFFLVQSGQVSRREDGQTWYRAS